MTKIDFAHWLEKRFLEWQQKQGGRRTAGEFAEWLGFENMTVNHWLNGKHTPTHGNAYILSFRLGLEVYDVLGMPRPDEELYQVQAHWHKPARPSTHNNSSKTRTAPGIPGAFCFGEFRNALALIILGIE